MKLFKKIFKAAIIGTLIAILGFIGYGHFIEHLILGREIHFKVIDLLTLLFYIPCSGTILYHCKYFAVYESSKDWEDVSTFDIFLQVLNIGFVGICILYLLLIMLEGIINIPMFLTLFCLGYLMGETIFIRKYLKRDKLDELSSDINSIGGKER